MRPTANHVFSFQITTFHDVSTQITECLAPRAVEAGQQVSAGVSVAEDYFCLTFDFTGFHLLWCQVRSFRLSFALAALAAYL